MSPSNRRIMVDLPQTSHIKLELRGGVLHLWLNRPERRNALSSQMVDEIAAAFAAIAADRSVRIVVLRGAGETFCAGGDIANMSVALASPPPGTPDQLRENNRRFGAVLDAINAEPPPTRYAERRMAKRLLLRHRSSPRSAYRVGGGSASWGHGCAD